MSEKIRKPSVKEKMFVKELIRNKGDGGAAAAAVYSTSGSNLIANNVAYRVQKRPAVQKFITELLDEKYPDHTEDYMKLVKLALTKAQDGTATLKEINDTLKVFADISGYKAPKETHNKTLKATVKLPGSE